MIRLAPLALLLGISVACSGDSEDKQLDWSFVQQDLDFAILGFWGPSTSDVFAVGGNLAEQRADDQASILKYEDGAWYRMETDAPTLWWAHGFSPTDVWAVGEQGTILHFDGTSWTTEETGADYTLWGIWGASPTDMWAVGGTVDGSLPSVLLHNDGTGWTEVPGVGVAGEFFFKIWGSSASDVYIVGDGGALLHYDGTSWTRLSSGTTDRLITVHGSGPDDVYAVGGLTESVVLHKDETGWSTVQVDTNQGLMGVCATAGQPALIVGWFGVMTVGSIGDWRAQDSLTDKCLHATWCDGNGNFLAGGGNLLAGGGDGVILGVGGDIAGGSVSAWSP